MFNKSVEKKERKKAESKYTDNTKVTAAKEGKWEQKETKKKERKQDRKKKV